jgi:hypothetical protein
MEGIKQFWGTTIGKILVIGILGSALIVCSLLGITLSRDNAPAASPAESQPESTATQTQPAATDTPDQATNTATPTETSLPNTALPTSSPDAAGTVPDSSPYLDEVNVNYQDFQNAFANARNYVQKPNTDPSVLLDENWKKDAEMALGQLNDAANQLESIDNPPPEHEQLDMYLKSIANETHMLVNNYGNGLDQLDPSAFSSAVNNLNNISSYMNSATTELDKYYNP